MRPLRLRLAGVTSYRAPQEIDLAGLDLFCVTGATGAGKSTIFDAIAFALYGRVPRVANRVRRLVASGCPEASVQLEFAVGAQRFRVTRRLRAAGPAHALLEGAEAGGGWAGRASGPDAVSRAVAELTGLDFPTFTRAVMLPQGQFAQFLAGEARERRAILVRLLDLGRYEDAGRRARQRADALRGQARAVGEAVGDQLADATPERVSAAQRDLEGQVRRATTLAAALRAAAGAAAAAAAAESEADALRSAAVRLAATLAAVDEVGRGWAAAAPREAAARRRLERSARALREAEARCRAAADRTAAAIAEVGAEGDLAALREAAAHVRAADRDLVSLSPRATRADREGRRCRAVVDARESADARGEAACARLARRVEDAVDAEARARADAERAARREQDLRALADARRAAHAHAAEAAAARAALAAALTRRRGANHALARLERAHQAAALRHDLVAGAPCPVCDRPAPPGLADLPGDGHEALDAARAAATDAGAGEDRAAAAERVAADGAAASAARLDQAAAQAAAHAAGPSRAHADAARAVAAAALDAARDRQARALAGRDEARRLLTASRAALERAEAALAGIEGERVAARRQRERALERLRLALGTPLPTDLAAAVGGREGVLRAARTAERLAVEAREAARAAHQAAQDERAEVDAARGGVLAALGARVAEGRMAEQALIAATPRTAPGPIPWPSAPDGLGDGALGRAGADLVAWARDRAEERLAHAAAEAAGVAARARDAGVGVAGPDGWLAALARAERAAVSDRARGEAEVEALRERRRMRRELEDRVAGLEAEARSMEWLGLHLQSDRFIDYVLGENLDALCARASERLRAMSSGRYSLAAAAGEEDGSFAVVDHHNADERRSVTTLSGGETFQASLALALALAESLTDLGGAARLEAVFVDEGFAALDAESLDLAIDALESVQAGDRMVGVITHVPQVAERIADGLDVVRGPAGSTVTRRS